MGAWGYGAFQSDGAQDWVWSGGLRDIIVDGLKARDDQFGIIRRAAAQAMVVLSKKTAQGNAGFSGEDVELAIESVQGVLDQEEAEGWSSYRDPAAAKRSVKSLLASVKRLR